MYDHAKPYRWQIIEEISKTWNSSHVKHVKSGAYTTFYWKDLPNYTIDHVDGIGTKGECHWQQKTWFSAVQDAMAMNLNDLLLVRAIPIKLTDHLTIPVEDKDCIMSIIRSLCSFCRNYDIVITGGETSIHNIATGLDLSLSMTGVVNNDLKNIFTPGDIVVGLPSSGLHSNGFTKVRQLLKPGEYTAELTIPTCIYWDLVFPINHLISGMCHITGGGLSKIKDLLQDDSQLIIDNPLPPQEVFQVLFDRWGNEKGMLTTFNCGCGFIMAVKSEELSHILNHLPKARVIGQVVKGEKGIQITSPFSGAKIFI